MRFLVMLAAVCPPLYAAAPTSNELQDASLWVQAKFKGEQLVVESAPSIVVHANNDPVQPNGRAGKQMNIAGKQYTRGLYCHAVSRLRVRLPKPGKTFEAVAGVDSNDQTAGGRGSIEFLVRVGDREAWKSGVMREGMPGKDVSVDLEGATEFWLEVGDAQDGISCDQADWADARVTLIDGSDVWLGDLPIEGAGRAPYSTDPFFSFVYGGVPSHESMPKWKLKRSSERIDNQRTRHRLRYSDPNTGLEVRCEGIEYRDFPTVEWMLYFRNTSKTDSPILSDIRAIDTRFERGAGSEFALYYNKGDNCTADSYEPLVETLKPGSDMRIANTGGRPTQIAFPYWNLNFGNQGLIAVVSWAGQWSAQFQRDAGNGLQLRAGQELTHFKLLPGEEVRTPMIVLQFYHGDRWHAQNVWRAWMLAHNLPRPGGKLPPVPQLNACSSHQFGEMIHANSDSQKLFIDKYLERGMKLDYWWMDAGWYWNKTGWPNTGTWEVDTDRFPGGLRPISDYAHARNVDIIVWFEPERVTEGTWLATTHPEWIHGGAKGGLLNLGMPDARAWLTDHVHGLIKSEGIDLYRQDFNMDPLSFWRANDAEDRQGITEIRHVEGYLAYWDDLRNRHPDMLIDSCASGGRRNDLETLRRAVPLLRSDYIMEPVGNQCHTFALSPWFPFYGTGTSKTDPYLIKSTLCPSFTACWDQRDDSIDWPTIGRVVDEWRAIAPNYLGDFYPITEYSLDNNQWIAWQFNRPDVGEGAVQVFRRADSVYESARLPLHGLDPDATYRIGEPNRADAGRDYDGKTLMERGLPVTLNEKPGAVFIVYTRH
ncbi:MAG: NPCBM/NEW2 domain-containing protein [Candidatus Hydrogenedentes bacterium]|nr:NPCBM/NEW2 domain-containing protein [Candidatus Hydrogenedentota bacterium]